MRKKDAWKVVRYLCIACIAVFGLVAILATGGDDVEDALCQEKTASGTFTFDDATDSLTVTGAGQDLPDYILDLIGGSYTITEEITATEMKWTEGGTIDKYTWTRSAGEPGDIYGTWTMEDEITDMELDVTYTLTTTDGDPDDTFTLKAEVCPW